MKEVVVFVFNVDVLQVLIFDVRQQDVKINFVVIIGKISYCCYVMKVVELKFYRLILLGGGSIVLDVICVGVNLMLVSKICDVLL